MDDRPTAVYIGTMESHDGKGIRLYNVTNCPGFRTHTTKSEETIRKIPNIKIIERRANGRY